IRLNGASSFSFTLRCDGDGGSVTQSVAVAVVAAVGTAALASGVRLLDDATFSLLTAEGPGEVVFSGAVSIDVGRVFVTRQGMYKAVLVRAVNGEAHGTTVEPTLDDIFDKLVIHGTFQPTSQSPLTRPAGGG